MKQKELIALIHLLEDNDRQVFLHVNERLKSMGSAIINTLEEVSTESNELMLVERIQELIKTIKQEDLLQDFQLWSQTVDPDILRGNFLISKFCNLECKFDQIYEAIIVLKKQIWLELHQYLTPFEQISILNQVIFYHQNFESAGPNEQKVSLYSLEKVLKQKKGNSLTLGVLYIIIAELLQIPIYGVFLPKHFILAYCKDFNSNKILHQDDVLFYINPLNKGAVFTRNEIKEYIKEMGLEDEPKYYLPLSSYEVVEGQLQHLKQVFDLNKKEDAVENLKSILGTINRDHNSGG